MGTCSRVSTPVNSSDVEFMQRLWGFFGEKKKRRDGEKKRQQRSITAALYRDILQGIYFLLSYLILFVPGGT